MDTWKIILGILEGTGHARSMPVMLEEQHRGQCGWNKGGAGGGGNEDREVSAEMGEAV